MAASPDRNTLSVPPDSGSGSPARPIAAFDFDGTLTVQDSFVAFLRWRTTWPRWALGLLRLAPDALAYLGHRDRGRLKAAAVRTFLKGVARDRLNVEAWTFMDACWPVLMRPDALAAWAAHRAAGDRLVIVTASPEETIAPFAERLEADDLIGSRLTWTADGHVAGDLDGPNCRGEEKAIRLRSRFGPEVALAAAYGDTPGDREMLAMSARPGMKVFRRRPARTGVSPS